MFNLISKRFVIAFLLLNTSIILADHDILDKLANKLESENVIQMGMMIIQDQYDESWGSKAEFELYKSNNYCYKDDNQIISVVKDTIWTYNMIEKQLLVDLMLVNDFSLFNLLSGQFDRIEIISVNNHNGGHLLEFEIPDFDIEGNIYLADDYTPIELILYFDGNNTVKIQITSFNENNTNQIEIIKPNNDWEIIDLRE